MSSIDRLGLVGLRSYNGERTEVIDFFKPVTLILGKNGSGKTTIIEALRFALCGITPPYSNNGRTFVRDPRLDGKTEMKGAVKLRFRAINGKGIYCARMMQLNFANQKDEIRKAEQYLKIRQPNGELVSISHTCMEMDKQVPELLGLSKAVIENVVLCHQEESLWPFADSMTLKKVFDDLFETARISKFAEQINTQMKEKKKALKDEKMRLELAKRDYEKHLNIKDDCTNTLKRLLELKTRLQEDEYLLQFDPDLGTLNEIQREMGTCDATLAQINRQLEDIKRHLDECENWEFSMVIKFVMRIDFETQFEICDEVFHNFLEQGLKHFKSNLPSSSSKKSEESEVEPGNIFIALEKIDEALSKNKNKVSDLTIELAQVNQNLRNNDTFNLVQDLKMMMEGLLSKKYEDFEISQPSVLDKITHSLQEIKESSEKVYQDLLMAIGKLEDTKINEDQKLRARLKGLQKKLNDDKLRESIEELQMFKQTLEQELDNQIDRKERRQFILQELMTSTNESNKAMTEIQLTNQTIANRKFRDLENQRTALCCSIDVDESWFKTENQVADKIKDLEKKIMLASKERSEIRAALSHEINNKKKKETQIQDLLLRIEKLEQKFKNANLTFDLSNPYKAYKALKEKVEKQKIKVNLIKYSMTEFLPKIMQQSLHASKCFLCDKSIPPSEANNIKEGLENRIARSNYNLIESETELQAEYANLQAVKEYRDDLKELELVKEQLDEAQKKLEVMINKIAELGVQNKTESDKFEDLDKKLKNFRTMQNLCILIENLDKSEIDPSFNCEAFRNQDYLVKTQKKKEQIGLEITKFKMLLEQLDRQMNEGQNKIIFLEQQIASTKINEVPNDSPDDVKIEDFPSKERLEKEIIKCQTDIDMLPLRIEKKMAELTSQKQSADKRLSLIKNCVDKVEHLKNIIINNPFPDIKKKLEKQIFTVDKIDQILHKIKSFINLWQQNLKLREDQNAQSTKRKSLEEADKHLQSKRQLFEEMKNKMNERKGQETVLQGNVDDLLDKMEKSKSTFSTFLKSKCMVDYIQNIIEDLEKFHRSTENALVEYHTTKIEEINKLIYTIWKTAYSGDDIDTIRILSVNADNPEQSKKHIAANRKSYEYKIVFVKQDGTQLPMKGKSSAGQRMLASIVIRLALSEAFCVNSGLLALDEPTTNLDQENIKLLAQFLKKLIKSRNKQESFQLIIITHDKEFINMIASHVESYYQISKDAGGFSKITMIPFEGEFA